MKLEDHPTVQRIRLKTLPSVSAKKEPLDEIARNMVQTLEEVGAVARRGGEL